MYPSLSNDALIDVIRLIRTQNVGPITFFQLMLRFGTAAEALKQLPAISIRGGRKNAITPYSKSLAEQEIEKAQKFGAHMIVYGDADYPTLLNHIADAPPVITILGHPSIWKNKHTVAMVGSRNSSANGCQLAQKIARECGAAGITIVSGLARGIDSFAHKGSLATGTVAVIAGGIDHIYPPENEDLYKQIAEQGAIISDQMFGQVPFASSFPARNRIIAGMSQGTVVVEASPKSGSLITARLATEYNRDVFAVPGSPLDPRSKGGNHLIKEGAYVVEEAQDILRVINNQKLIQFSEATSATYNSITSPNEAEIDRARETILTQLGHTATEIDELIEQTQLSTACVQAVLMELELAGRLRRNVGNKISIIFNESQEVA
jgi:DNA processing protein